MASTKPSAARASASPGAPRRIAAQRRAAPIADPLDFHRHLASSVDDARRGERTRLKLMVFGLELLAGTSFRDLNVDDVVRAAKLAKGTFYIHFPSKDAFLVEMARRYVAFEVAAVPAVETAGSGYARVRNWLAWYEGMFARNVGVLRCLVQAAEGSEEMRSLWHRRNDALVDDLMQRFFPVPADADPTLPRLVLRISGGMVDQSLLERYQVQVGPGRREPEDDALRLELHALLSYRAIFGADPPADELTATHQLLGWPGSR